ncbi:ABC transporter G family member 31-like [Gossypium arboreum]|uniref:ABC transporter G family member 31-like n=1 Tax=Gossypium arboreum TaxID=29729 RepID=UPI0008196D88|nr:ABC transporter G family member 31-like [Gossypium arboreum]
MAEQLAMLPVFYKQRDNLFHPAWIWSVISWSICAPYSAIEAGVWSGVLYTLLVLPFLLGDFSASRSPNLYYTKWQLVYFECWLPLLEIWSLQIPLGQLHLYFCWVDLLYLKV